MKRLALLLLLAAAPACTRTGDNSVPSDTTAIPIGPGSDSTALIPPDTPGSPPRERADTLPSDTTRTPRPR